MERKLASVQKIISLEPIKDADMILKATILGWELVVAKKDNFKVGDLCVYCEVDSIMPDKSEFEFLRERKFRIKTIKLKGQVSQGICFPVDIVHKVFHVEGRDVTEILGVTKYDPQAEFERKETLRLTSLDKNRMTKFLKRYAWYRNLFFKPIRIPFPSFIRKTDEDRIQLFSNACEQWKGVLFEVTEKLDGQSGTYFVIPNPRKGIFRNKWLFGVCSRNFQLLKEDDSSYWTIAKQENIKEKLINYAKEWGCGVIIQGEILGNKIQGNKYDLKGFHFFVFNVAQYYRGQTDCYNQTQQNYFCDKLGLKTVPLLGQSQLTDNIHDVIETSKGKSVLNDIFREGIVMRSYKMNISFKIVNPDFLLKYSE
jgi:hypothetical protein